MRKGENPLKFNFITPDLLVQLLPIILQHGGQRESSLLIFAATLPEAFS